VYDEPNVLILLAMNRVIFTSQWREGAKIFRTDLPYLVESTFKHPIHEDDYF